MKKINSAPYSILIGKDSLRNIDLLSYSKIAIVVDENTKKHCLSIFLSECQINSPLVIEISSSEKNKTLESCQYIWDMLTNHQFDRYSLLINLGGGVIGDMGGFAASCYKRGIDFIQVPTTLLAMVDASIGGKLGVNFMDLKNQIGLFKNPKTVLIFPEFLTSLKKSHLISGFAEVVKYALIYDANLWKVLKETPLMSHNWEEIIIRSVEIKNNVVAEDPLEKGKRKILNFGHTIGHAIESYYLSKKKNILHGEAIAMGMLVESQLSNIEQSEKKDIEEFIENNFPKIHIPSFEKLLPYLINDKKNNRQNIVFSLLKEIGHCEIDCTVNSERISKAIKSYI